MGKLYQKYISAFSCLASECPDTCCANWQICIDEDTAREYLNDGGEVGNVARECMRGKINNAHLCLNNKRCPYLTSANLCRVIELKGERALSKVCAMHPRFIHPLFEDDFEFLSLSCPRVSKMFIDGINEGGIAYGKDDLQNPYLSQFYDYVCEIFEQFKQINIVKEMEKTPNLQGAITELFSSVFSRMEYLETPTKTALESLSYCDFSSGYTAITNEYGNGFFAELFKYFALVLYNEKSPVLPTAFLFSLSVCALYSRFNSLELAIYKFVKETEHSGRNIKMAIRIMRSKKAQIILAKLFCFGQLF
jgi:hypothetical protein